MKLWLNEILACPMDKHFPLKLFIFDYETTQEEFNKIIEKYTEKNIEKILEENIIHIIKVSKNEIEIKDNIIIKPKPLLDYLHQIIHSIDELKEIYDKSSTSMIKKCLEIILTTVKNKITQFLDLNTFDKIEELLPELYLLNKIKIDIEINTGLILCEECNRWFPIVETIPKMLPDEYRNEKEDLEFLSQAVKNNYVNKEFLPNLKPFTL